MTRQIKHYDLSAVFTTLSLGATTITLPQRLPKYCLVRTMPDNRYYLTTQEVAAGTNFMTNMVVDTNIWRDLSIAAGTITYFAGPRAKVPTGWLIADGTVSFENTSYPRLYKALTYTGMSTGSNQTLVPNLSQGYMMATPATNPPSVPFVVAGVDPRNPQVTLNATNFPQHGHPVSYLSMGIGGNHTHSLTSTTATHNANMYATFVHGANGDNSFEGGSGYYWGYSSPYCRVGAHYHVINSAYHQHTLSGTTPATGSNTPVNVGQPSIQMYAIIKG